MSDERLAEIATIGSWSEVPAFATEAEEAEYWSTHGPDERLLEAFMPDSMSDERLAEIERNAGLSCRSGACAMTVGELIAEVRRLRRALRLSEASRGVPATVGRD